MDTLIESSSGAIFASGNTVLNFNGTSNFVNNYVSNTGGAIYICDNTTISFNGTSNFINNLASMIGGAIVTSDNSVLNFNGINNFINNSAYHDGGAIYTSDNTVVNFNGINKFINNSADLCRGGVISALGSISILDNTVLNFIGISNFTNNSASRGGTIYASDNVVLSFNGISNFINNLALGEHEHEGTISGGGTICASDNTVISFNGISNFINNSAVSMGGGVISVSRHSQLSFNGTSNFVNNLVYSGGGGAIYAINNNVLNFSGTSNFVNNSAGTGGAIYTSIKNALTFSGTIYFTNNGHYGGEVHMLNGYIGGGVYMGIKSTISILPHTTVYWENNYATHGGAIYVQDASPTSYCIHVSSYLPKEQCFFQLPDQDFSNGFNVQLVFKNNFADDAGSVLYGGAVNNCKLTHGPDTYSSDKVFDMIVHNDDTDYSTASNISSDPIYTCPCKNDCSFIWYDVPHIVYSGETFQVSVTSFGQRHGTVSSGVISKIDQSLTPGDDLPDSQRLQQAKSTCTNLNYTLFSLAQTVKIKLHAEGNPCASFGGIYILDIHVKLNQTSPYGFNISFSNKSCVCEQKLAQYTHQCHITNGIGQITCDLHQQFWVGYDNKSDGLILHPLCPFDYCVSHKVVVTLNNTDIQCAYHRSGLLCGRCKEGYSLVLGASQCKQCTNNHLVLLIPFAVMGVSLVFLLLVCRLTVATGTLMAWCYMLTLLESIAPSFYQRNLLLFSQSSLHG